ncbi:unnamed protein product [Bursaphelenchus okinawaensis]|uniref:Uncharacterized protein n=1 Tax=Bursaphelenchus okinawaensis TaxID=465554 RepID=A0A811KUI7_9BILA|nr:unnamed protein product [Bursaphelenchus okinawaensis]CAG9112250.1 unnamed protein product [Bursaphelenchus okinawaensis]
MTFWAILQILLLCPLLGYCVIERITIPTTTATVPRSITPKENLDGYVDRIEAIDVSSNQVVITTSKVGPPEDVQVSIDVVDLSTGEKLPPINLTGILLFITRGRYTVNFLRPNTWYGIAFRSKQQHRPEGPIYIDFEEHLIRTHREDGSNLDGEPIVSVGTSRLGNDGKSVENLVLTLKWEQHPDERQDLDMVANVSLVCDKQIKFKQVFLNRREIEKSIEVKLDNNFEVLETNNKSRQIMASITPKHCHKICWLGSVYSNVQGYNFKREVAKKCESITTITTTAKLREYKSYEVKNNSLIVHTTYLKEHNDTIDKESYVQLTAIPIPENFTTKVNSTDDTTRYKVFSTSEGDTYTLPNLVPGRLYATQYTYVKQSPFAYAESRRFIIETQLRNTIGHAVKPIQVEVHFPKKTNSTDSKTISDNSSTKPTAKVKLNPQFHKYKVGVDLEPFCNQKNGTHIWLDADRNEFRLPTSDLVQLQQNQKKCSPNLCYTTSMIVKEKVYSMERHCQNLATDLPPPIPIQRDSGVSRYSTASLLLFYIMYMLL